MSLYTCFSYDPYEPSQWTDHSDLGALPANGTQCYPQYRTVYVHYKSDSQPQPHNINIWFTSIDEQLSANMITGTMPISSSAQHIDLTYGLSWASQPGVNYYCTFKIYDQTTGELHTFNSTIQGVSNYNC